MSIKTDLYYTYNLYFNSYDKELQLLLVACVFDQLKIQSHETSELFLAKKQD